VSLASITNEFDHKKNEKEKEAIQAQELKRTQMSLSLSSHYLIWSDSGLGRGFDLFGVSRIE
jgi:hypothetical protein